MSVEIAELLATPEGKTLEFKRDLSSLKKIVKTVVAFANTAGGTIIIGREDNGNTVGVEDPLVAEEKISSTIADSILPMIMPDIEIVSWEGSHLLLISVAHWPGPFYIKAEGPVDGVYVRLGSTNRKAGPEFIVEIERMQKNKSFDQLPCPAFGIDALDMPFLQKTFAGLGKSVTEHQLNTLGILTPYGKKNVPTHGGLILFGQPSLRQQILPDARVSCARFSGTNKTDFIDRLDLEGSIIEAIEQVPIFIRRNTRLFPKISGMKREDISAYPVAAVREVLVNAVTHCDYSLTGMRIMVAIFDDRMEIQSPGTLPLGMTIEDFKAGLSRIRNRVIARTFRELGLMEEWGSGYRRVIDHCTRGGYKIPEWQEVGPAIRVTVFPHSEVREHLTDVPINVPINVPENVPENVPISERQRWFIEQIRIGKVCKASDLAAHWQVTEKTAKRDIADLKKKGWVEFVGAPKTGGYVLQEKKGTPFPFNF